MELTDREMEVLKLIAEGYSSEEIGFKLFISSDAVKSRRLSIYNKLDAINAPHAIAVAFRKRILE